MIIGSDYADALGKKIDEWLDAGAVNLETAMWLDTKGYLCENVQRKTVLEAYSNHKATYVGNALLASCVNEDEMYTDAEIAKIESGFIGDILAENIRLDPAKIVVYHFWMSTGRYAAVSHKLLGQLRSAFMQGGRKGMKLTSWNNFDTWCRHGPGYIEGGFGVMVLLGLLFGGIDSYVPLDRWSRPASSLSMLLLILFKLVVRLAPRGRRLAAGFTGSMRPRRLWIYTKNYCCDYNHT